MTLLSITGLSETREDMMDHKSKGRRFIAALTCLATAFAFMPLTAAQVSAETDESYTSTRGVYWFDPHEVGTDLTDTFIYDDALLTGDSLDYDQKLATMSYELAIASISSEREPKTPEGYANKSRNLRAYLEDNGFIDFETNQYYKEKMKTNSMGAACAHKTIKDGGKEYTLLAIVPRSAGYESEWGGNFEMGDVGDHHGFRNGKNIVLDFARQYVADKGIKGDLKVWTAGYSRGGGVTNQVAAALIADPKAALASEDITLEPGNIYCYTFGTPNSAGSPMGEAGDPNDGKFNYIHNTWEPYDIVTVAPPAGLGFTRYGTNTGYASADRKDRMLGFLKVTNPNVYDLYMNGGDPDSFIRKTIDIQKLISERKIEITEDPESYLPGTQAEFLEMMGRSICEAVGSERTVYANDYQTAFRDLCGYFFSHISDAGKLTEGITDSTYVAPMVGFLYISYMIDRYSDTRFSDQNIAQINKAVDLLETIIAEAKDDNKEVPESLEDSLALFKSELRNAVKWGDAKDQSWLVTSILYSDVMREGLIKAEAEEETINTITSDAESSAMTRFLAYLLLYDEYQTEQVISFDYTTQQMKHFATFMGNAPSYMRPHNNEIILSWLRTMDSSYDDFVKENDAQKAGYRRVYISQPEGVTVTGTVKNSGGSTVATFAGGAVRSRTDKWIGITTCDSGSWLRLPVSGDYRVDLKVSKTAGLSLKLAEYETYGNREVRTVTKDKKYDWTKLNVKAGSKVTLVVPAVTGKTCKLPSAADYHLEKPVNVLAAKGTAKGKSSLAISWNKVSGADRYVISLAKGTKKNKLRKVKTVKGTVTKWTAKKLKRSSKYIVRVQAQAKVGGKYETIATSRIAYTVTGNKAGKFTNPKSLKLKKTKISLKKGKSYTIKATVKKVRAKKKLMTRYVSKLRYVSTAPDIAKVSTKGKVTAVAKGNCTVYVQTINGLWKKLNVTVR